MRQRRTRCGRGASVMGRIIAVANQKGGVGKTTTSINLAASLASTGRAILLVDMDPQGNATMGLGVDKTALERTACDVLLEEAAFEDVVVSITEVGVSLLPGNGDMTAAEVQLRNRRGGEVALKQALAAANEFDYVVIDCPPALSMLTVNALAAADHVLIPMQCEYYALEGLSDLLDTLEQVRTVINPQLQVAGLLRTMYDPRNRLSCDVSAQLLEHFPGRVLRTIIPRNVRLAEAPSYGLPAYKYDPGSKGAQAYLALAAEMLRRNGESLGGIDTGRGAGTDGAAVSMASRLRQSG